MLLCLNIKQRGFSMKGVKIQATISEKSVIHLDELSKKMGLKKSVLIDLAIKELAKKEAKE